MGQYIPGSSLFTCSNRQRLRTPLLQCAHVMAMAVQRLFPEARTTIGPCIENGFYYDFDMAEPITDADLKRVKAEMVKIIKADLPLVCQEVSPAPCYQYTHHRQHHLCSACITSAQPASRTPHSAPKLMRCFEPWMRCAF